MIFLCSLHALQFLIKRTYLSSLEASWLLVGIGVGILSIISIMCVHLQPMSTSLLQSMCSKDISAEGQELLRQWNSGRAWPCTREVALSYHSAILDWPGSLRLGGTVLLPHAQPSDEFVPLRGSNAMNSQTDYSMTALFLAIMKWSLLYKIFFFPQEFK